MSMIQDIVTRIAAALEGTTPGPWHRSGDGIIQTHHITRDVWQIPRVEQDLTLIAQAPTLLREAAATITRLRTEVAEAEQRGRAAAIRAERARIQTECQALVGTAKRWGTFLRIVRNQGEFDGIPTAAAKERASSFAAEKLVSLLDAAREIVRQCRENGEFRAEAVDALDEAIAALGSGAGEGTPR